MIYICRVLYSKDMQNKKGFTLLELLVVVSIIGLLMAMGTVAFMTAQQRGRDSKRRSDMQAVQKAFEQYHAVNGGVYAGCEVMATAEFLPNGLPTDPRPANSYVCTGNAVSYCACAELEEEGSGNASDSSCTYQANGNFFCVNNLQ